MKASKIIEAAKWAKETGHTHICSIVKSHYATSYYHLVKVDDVLDAGKWIPSKRMERGIAGNKIDWKTTVKRSFAIYKSQELINSKTQPK